MCEKCWKSGRMSSLMVLDNDYDLVVYQLVDDQPIAGAMIGPLDEVSVARVEEFATRIRQALTLRDAKPEGVVH